MFRAFQALLQPTGNQVVALDRLLESQRELYNAALEERIGAWRWEGRAVTRFEQFRALSGWEHPVLEFGIRPARGTLTRLDRAFQSFFRRCEAGQTPGFPRFKSSHRWDSVEYPDQLCWQIESKPSGVGRLRLHGVGAVRFRGAKQGIRGTPKSLALRREGNRWRVTVFGADVEGRPLEPTGAAVGIDLGVTQLVATSHGELVENPRHLRRAAKQLAVSQRLVAGRTRGSSRRLKAVKRVARLHRKIANQRRDFAHQLSRRLVNGHDVVVHERLSIEKMVRRPASRPNEQGGFDPNGAAAKAGLNREILAAGWAQLLRFIAYKAEEAGRETVAVDPRHTSQRCHRCGHVEARNRCGAEFRCRACGHVAHADVNAARNILRAGLARRHER